jgi:Protein of unknown function (DUF2442)
MNPRVKQVQYERNYKLILVFLNEEIKEFDLRPYLQFPIYELLQDELFCMQAHVFNGTVVWNDEIDFDPDILYLESKSLVLK